MKNQMNHYNPRKSIISTSIVLLLFVFVLFNYGYAGAVNNTNYIKNHNQIGDRISYVIKYNAGGGFIGRHDYILYNSTTNHLISNYITNTSHYDSVPSNALFDLQLTDAQQKNLSKLVMEGHLFNTSFNNNKPQCCDISYYGLEVILINKLNSASWRSGNTWDDTNYKKIPAIVTTIVDTLNQFTANSKLLFSESKIKDN
jgi:hypothetical protein